jgi:hypothetical protein
MEYKYHPIIKHLTYFILCYLFLRHQNLMSNQILIINSVILTLFVIVLDHIFINGHVSPIEPLNYEYVDEEEIKKIEKQIKKEKRRNKKKQKIQKVKLTDPNDNFSDEKVINPQKIDESMLNELGYINNNTPGRIIQDRSDRIDHRDYVDIFNRLDNTTMTGSNFDPVDQFNFNVKAYNE